MKIWFLVTICSFATPYHQLVLVDLITPNIGTMVPYTVPLCMVEREKLLEKARSAPQNLRFSDLLKLAQEFGWEFDRQSGSHRIFRHTRGSPRRMNFQDKNGKAKPYQVRQLLAWIDEHGDD